MRQSSRLSGPLLVITAYYGLAYGTYRLALALFPDIEPYLPVGGIEALLIRVQLAAPNGEFLSADAYNQMFTMHATTMVFLVVMKSEAKRS